MGTTVGAASAMPSTAVKSIDSGAKKKTADVPKQVDPKPGDGAAKRDADTGARIIDLEQRPGKRIGRHRKARPNPPRHTDCFPRPIPMPRPPRGDDEDRVRPVPLPRPPRGGDDLPPIPGRPKPGAPIDGGGKVDGGTKGDKSRPQAPDGQHYDVNPGTGEIELQPDVDNLLWTSEHQRNADRGWHYGVDPGTGEIVQQPNVDNLLWTSRDQEIADRGWHYGVDPETGEVVQIDNVQQL